MNIAFDANRRGSDSRTPALSPFASLIDDVGQHLETAVKAEKAIKAAKEKLKPYEAALKKLQAAINAHCEETGRDSDVVGQEVSAAFVAEYGKAPRSRSVTDMAMLRELLGDAVFMQLVRVKLSDIDDYLTPPQRKQVIQEGRGLRPVVVRRRDKV